MHTHFRFALLAVSTALTIAASPNTWANGRYPAAGLIAFHPTSPKLAAARTTYGLLTSRDAGASWQWVCEGAYAMMGEQDPFILWAGADRLLVATYSGLRHADGDLCQWSETTKPLYVGNLPAIDLARDPTNPNRVVALVSEAFQIYRLVQSVDGGLTWQPLGPTFAPGTRVRTVDIAASTGRIYVTTSVPGDAAAELLWRSDDGGQSWQSLPVAASQTDAQGAPLSAAKADVYGAYIGAVDPNNADRVYVRVYGEEKNYLWQTDDAGHSWTVRHESAAQLLGFALSPDGKQFAVGGLQPKGGALWLGEAKGGAVEKQSGVRVRCLTWTAAGLFACGDEAEDGFTLGVSQDGGKTFAPVHHRQALVQATCAATSSVGVHCPLAWPAQAKKLGIGGPDAGNGDAIAVVEPSSSPAKTGCRSGPVGGDYAGWLAMILVGALRWIGAAWFRRALART